MPAAIAGLIAKAKGPVKIAASMAAGPFPADRRSARRWLQRCQDKRQEQLQLDVRIMEEGHALRQEAYQREREALKALDEERERHHKAELAALEAQMQAKLEALTRANEGLTRQLNRVNDLGHSSSNAAPSGC